MADRMKDGGGHPSIAVWMCRENISHFKALLAAASGMEISGLLTELITAEEGKLRRMSMRARGSDVG